MEARLAYVPLQSIIDICHKQLTATLYGMGLDLLSDVTLDHFAFVTARKPYFSERESFDCLLQGADDYVIEAGFATIGAQSARSDLKWGEQRLDTLVLLGDEAIGVTTGYIAVTVTDLEKAAYQLYQANLGHSWEKLFGRRCVVIILQGSRLPMFRLYILEQSVQQLRHELDRLRY